MFGLAPAVPLSTQGAAEETDLQWVPRYMAVWRCASCDDIGSLLFLLALELSFACAVETRLKA